MRYAGGTGPGRPDDGLSSVVGPVPAGRGGPAGRVFPVGDPARAAALTAGLTATGLLLAVDVARPRRPWDVVAIAAGTIAVGAGTGMALTAIDVHYPTDTVGGAGTAVALVLGTARIVDALAQFHHWRHNRHSCTESH